MKIKTTKLHVTVRRQPNPNPNLKTLIVLALGGSAHPSSTMSLKYSS